MQLSHMSENGANMVDTSHKDATLRIAKASGKICLSEMALNLVKQMEMPKGDVLGVAKIAGIMAAKNTATTIPLCHNIPIEKVDIDFDFVEGGIIVTSMVKTYAKTGVEMEALHAVTIALLTIYDMCKAVEKSMEIKDISLLSKSGGKSGDYIKE